jgi:ribonuclease P protein component
MEKSLNYTFSKEERLCSEKILARLYESGFVISKYPLRLNVLLLTEEEFNQLLTLGSPTGTKYIGIIELRAQISINASKKRLKRAVVRNRMKRILREIYRHKKHQIYADLAGAGQFAAIGLIYVGNSEMTYWDVEKVFDKVRRSLRERVIAAAAPGSAAGNSLEG